MALKEETIEIPIWKLKKIANTLRIVSRIFSSEKQETCIDRQIVESKKFIEETLNGEEYPLSLLTVLEQFKKELIYEGSDKKEYSWNDNELYCKTDDRKLNNFMLTQLVNIRFKVKITS